MSTIEITNVGPVAHVSIPIPDGGGVVVMRGRNGRGKSACLNAVEGALNGRGKLEVRDGQKSGEVDAFGVQIKIGRSVRRSGELEVQSLEGKLSVAELVDPGIKSPDAADAKRIKALVQLGNVLPSAELFYPLLGGQAELEKYVGATALASDDLITMADRIKRDLEASARKEEEQSATADGHARGSREAAGGVDVQADCDSKILQAELEAAIREDSKLKAEAQAAAEARSAAQLATDELEDAEAKYMGPSLYEAEAAEKAAEHAVNEAQEEVRKAEAALESARQRAGAARADYSNKITVRKQAEQHERSVKQWREQIAKSIPAAPAPEALVAAALRVAKAREAVEQGALIRKAKQHLEDAEKHSTTASKHRRQAEKLREAAKATDEVLSSVVAQPGCPLRVEAGRLVLDTHRGVTFYGELSHGERWKIALDIAIEAVGPKGVLTIPQEAYEALDPINRRLIADHVKGRGVVILTAEATEDEELTAEIYGQSA